MCPFQLRKVKYQASCQFYTVSNSKLPVVIVNMSRMLTCVIFSPQTVYIPLPEIVKCSGSLEFIQGMTKGLTGGSLI